MLKKYVVTGAQGSGKSSLIQSLLKRAEIKGNIYVMDEVAAYLISREIKSKKPVSEWVVPWNKSKHYEFQSRVFDLQSEWEDGIARCTKKQKAVLDRSLIDGLAYLRLNGYQDSELYSKIKAKAKKSSYEQVFFLEMIKPEENEIRRDVEAASEIEKLLLEVYCELGYEPIIVPRMSLEQRVEFVLPYLK